ncbi:MAG: hypothetical protein GC180_04915 [Bacteroidetes bacterium]|nr:hypothetical protein [Bacteroidota bacterium]
MLYQLEKLNKEEKELVLNAPAYITILIAGADDDITEAEVKRSLQLVHIKTYSESVDIRDVYQEIDHDYEGHLNELIESMPKNLEERTEQLVKTLSKLNGILKKIDHRIAHKYYLSLLSFAAFIARAAGGVLGFDRVSFREEKYVHLPMIQDPNTEQ